MNAANRGDLSTDAICFMNAVIAAALYVFCLYWDDKGTIHTHSSQSAFNRMQCRTDHPAAAPLWGYVFYGAFFYCAVGSDG